MSMPASDRCDLLCLDLPKAEAVRAGIAALGAQQAAGRARALADPTRLQLAAALALGDELCVCDLAWIAGRSDKLVSHHVRILRDAGIAENRRDGKIVFYRLTATGTDPLAALAIGGVATREAVRSWRGDACSCCAPLAIEPLPLAAPACGDACCQPAAAAIARPLPLADDTRPRG
jgi:DNA-binding transcriptional ArsR family regulator